MHGPVRRNFRSLLSRLSDFRVGTTVGFALFALSLLAYQSYESRQVFGIWSYPFFTLVVATYLGLAFWIFRTLRVERTAARSAYSKAASISLDLAVLLWGMAYFISALENRRYAGRVTDLNFLGSIPPVPSMLEWLALCLGTLAALLAIVPKLGQRHANALISVAATVFTLLAIEGGLRAYFAIAPMTQSFPTNANEMWSRRYALVNSEGLRDAEHAKAADPSVRRLLVVGDSYAFGWGIKQQADRFGEQVTARLVESTGKAWESMNASQGDTDTLEHIKLLEKMLLYRPQLVLLLYVFNDIDYIQRVTPDWKAARISLLGVLFSNSHIFQQAYLLYKRSRGRFDGVTVYEDDQLVTCHLADIRRFVTLAADQGAKVFVVPMDVSVARSGGPRPGHKNFLRLAEQAGIPLISALGLFQGMEHKELIVSRYDGHPNERAFRIAAAYIADELRQRLPKGRQ